MKGKQFYEIAEKIIKSVTKLIIQSSQTPYAFTVYALASIGERHR
jgi:hypothetical protein